jgi:hypothetical protein
MQDPLKQGLKPNDAEKALYADEIRMQDPLKQGLKPLYSIRVIISIIIRMQDPLKQGLKRPPCSCLYISKSNSNARSTKTRIETKITEPKEMKQTNSNARSTKTRIETIRRADPRFSR